MDYSSCVAKIQRRCNCSLNEAWEGLNEAFLTLDRTQPEAAQYWWLIRVGSWNVADAVRQRYIGKTGVMREESSDFLTHAAPDSDEYEWDFLNAFPKGLVREFAKRLADGHAKFTEGSCNYWLRSQHNINNRRTAKEIINEVRIYSKRI